MSIPFTDEKLHPMNLYSEGYKMQDSIVNNIDWEKVNGLIPAVIQDAHTSTVLMLGYMSPEALEKTLAEKRVTFFSRTKGRLWTKGESSGNYLNLQQIHLDCDADTLLIRVNPQGPTCHVGTSSCFNKASKGNFLFTLYDVITQRKLNPSEKSYTASLFEKGINRIAQKVGEEAVEVILAPHKNEAVKENIISETADLMFHLLVFLNAYDVTIEDILTELEGRHGKTKPV